MGNQSQKYWREKRAYVQIKRPKSVGKGRNSESERDIAERPLTLVLWQKHGWLEERLAVPTDVRFGTFAAPATSARKSLLRLIPSDSTRSKLPRTFTLSALSRIAALLPAAPGSAAFLFARAHNKVSARGLVFSICNSSTPCRAGQRSRGRKIKTLARLLPTLPADLLAIRLGAYALRPPINSLPA